MKIKFSKSFLYLHLVFSYLVQNSCGHLMGLVNEGYWYIITISLLNLFQIVMVRSCFHVYSLKGNHKKLFVAECICAVVFVIYNLLMYSFVYKPNSIYFIDILVYIILLIPFVISMAKIED